jgi:predicted HicB family RNase H-like nuclease
MAGLVKTAIVGKRFTDHRKGLRMNFESESQNDQSTWTNTEVADGRASKSASSRLREKAAEEAGERLAAEMKVFNQVAGELKAKRDASVSTGLRRKQVLDVATELFGVAPTWTAFYREVVGGSGVARSLFCDPAELREFEASEEFSKVMEMLTVLRSRDLPENDPHEPQRMITVRMPKSLHDAICDEANALSVSVNKLCISRLMQKLDSAMIPASGQKRRGRRPGSAGMASGDAVATQGGLTADQDKEQACLSPDRP